MWSYGIGIVRESLDDNDKCIIHLGHHGPSVLVIGARDVCDALEAAASWAEKHCPGVFVDMGEAYREAAEDLGLDPSTQDDEEQEEIREQAETDLTYTESGWLSWDWSYEESPDRERILDLQSRHLYDKRGTWVQVGRLGDGKGPEEVGKILRVHSNVPYSGKAEYTLRTWGGRIVRQDHPYHLYDRDLVSYLEGAP